MTGDEITLRFLEDDWLEFVGMAPYSVRVQARPDARGELRVHAIQLISAEPIDGALLRSVKLGWIERKLNLPDIRRAITVPQASLGGYLKERNVKFGAFLSEIPLGTSSGVGRRPLVKPHARPYPESFWRDVARAYREALFRSESPAEFIRREASTNIETAKGWIKKARRRGYLTGGTRGRQGEVGADLLLRYVGKDKFGTVPTSEDEHDLRVRPGESIAVDPNMALNLLDQESDWELLKGVRYQPPPKGVRDALGSFAEARGKAAKAPSRKGRRRPPSEPKSR